MITGYADYMLLLRPDEGLCLEISGYKKFAATLIGDYPSMYSTAHISLAGYTRKKPYLMHQAIDSLHAKLTGIPAAKLQMNNFRFFIHKNNTYTIYAAIEPSFQTDNWFALLGKQLHISKGSFVPHVTIARTINENSFYRLWPQFKYISFRQEFSMNSLTVLERETLNSQSKWGIYREFLFEHQKAGHLT